MPKIICPRCGAVVRNEGDFRICPHCGRDCARVFTKRFLPSIHYLLPALIYIATLGPTLSILFDVEWKYWAIAGFVIAVGLGWVFVARKFRREYDDPTADLNVFAKHGSEIRNQKAPDAPQMPELPRNWKSLISMHRPREVYLPTGSKISVLFSGLFVAASILFFAWGFANHRGPFSKHMDWHRGWAPLLYYIAAVPASLLMIWREVVSRKLLRDGEVTIGYWNEGAYEFWTQSGQRFRRNSVSIPSTDAIFGIGLVPVFYLSQDPTKCVALCSVYSRIRVPADEQFQGIPRVSARL